MSASTLPASVEGATGAKAKSLPKAPPVSARKIRELQADIASAKSATAVVQLARPALEDFWHAQWGADALLQIAKRSTARTRMEWVSDATVKKIAEKLEADIDVDYFDVLLIAMEALRRMKFQTPLSQSAMLQRALAVGGRRSVTSLVRLFWLAAPLKLDVRMPDHMRERCSELTGSDIALVVAAFRQRTEQDKALLEKVCQRLSEDGVYKELSATDMVELAEGFVDLKVQGDFIRPLGQEILRRRGELTPDENRRVHDAYKTLGIPLKNVWTEPGCGVKRDAMQLVTTQAFAPQEGHEKKRRGYHDVERTSPPRVVRDYKMMSY